MIGKFDKLGRTRPATFERPVCVGWPQPVVCHFEALAVGRVGAGCNPVPLEPRLAVWTSCNLEGREQVPAKRAVLPCPRLSTSS